MRSMTTRAHRCGRKMAYFAIACLLAASAAMAHDQPIVLLHYFTGSLTGGVGEMVAAYNRRRPEHPLEARGLEHESFKSAIKGLLSSGNMPELFSYWAGERTRYMVDKGYLVPVDDVWTTQGLHGVIPSVIAQHCYYRGHMYAVPVTAHVVGVFYDKKRFSELGLTPPRTWPEFVNVCRALKQVGVVRLALGNKERWPAQFWFDLLLLRTAGPAYRDKLMHGDASYTDAEVRRVFGLWESLLRMGAFNANMSGLDWAGAAALLHSGEAAMTVMGTWISGYYGIQLHWQDGVDYDFFPFPFIDAGIPEVALGAIDTIVMTTEGRKHNAQQALALFGQADLQALMSSGSGALAPTRMVSHDVYSPMKHRIADSVSKAVVWQNAYDLATPGPEAEVGLGLFEAFLSGHHDTEKLLESVEMRMRMIRAGIDN